MVKIKKKAPAVAEQVTEQVTEQVDTLDEVMKEKPSGVFMITRTFLCVFDPTDADNLTLMDALNDCEAHIVDNQGEVAVQLTQEEVDALNDEVKENLGLLDDDFDDDDSIFNSKYDIKDKNPLLKTPQKALSPSSKGLDSYMNVYEENNQMILVRKEHAGYKVLCEGFAGSMLVDFRSSSAYKNMYTRVFDKLDEIIEFYKAYELRLDGLVS